MRFSLRGILRSSGAVFVATLVIAAGCSPSKGTITGVVKYKDTVLKGGNVTFVSDEGKQSQGSPISEDGTYTISDMPIGPVKIAVETESLDRASKVTRGSTPPPGSGKPAETKMDPAEFKKRYTPIPHEYDSTATSGLTYTVTSGSQKHDIELK